MPAVPETKAAWVNNVDPLNSTNLHAYLRDPIKFLMGKPAARLRQTVAQGLAHNADTPLQFNAEDFDTDIDGLGGHSTSSNTSRYTCRYPGVFSVGGAVAISSNATGFRGTVWMVNGSFVNSSKLYFPANGTAASVIPARPMLLRLTEGDYLELAGFQSSGGVLNTFTSIAEFTSSMDVAWERL